MYLFFCVCVKRTYQVVQSVNPCCKKKKKKIKTPLIPTDFVPTDFSGITLIHDDSLNICVADLSRYIIRVSPLISPSSFSFLLSPRFFFFFFWFIVIELIIIIVITKKKNIKITYRKKQNKNTLQGK